MGVHVTDKDMIFMYHQLKTQKKLRNLVYIKREGEQDGTKGKTKGNNR